MCERAGQAGVNLCFCRKYALLNAYDYTVFIFNTKYTKTYFKNNLFLMIRANFYS